MRKTIAILYLTSLLFVCGCNARIWGDNMLREWFRGNKWNNKINDKRVYSSNITGIPARDIPKILFTSSIPFLIILYFNSIHRKRTTQYALSFLIGLIEQCKSTAEIKRLSAILSKTDHKYKRLIHKELDKINSKK